MMGVYKYKFEQFNMYIPSTVCMRWEEHHKETFGEQYGAG